MCGSQEKFQKKEDSFPPSFAEGEYRRFILKYYYPTYALILIGIMLIHGFALKGFRIDYDIKSMLISLFMLPIILHIYFYRFSKKGLRKIIKLLILCL
jgi:uncharacterized membrane protein